MVQAQSQTHPLMMLGESDLEFVSRFVLASGSLKDLAKAYGVSYPTIRAKLDQLIARLQEIIDERPRDPMADFLADLIEKGEISPSGARTALDMHRKALKRAKED
jgi:hypothetical protein